jgi:cytidylate kinase
VHPAVPEILRPARAHVLAGPNGAAGGPVPFERRDDLSAVGGNHAYRHLDGGRFREEGQAVHEARKPLVVVTGWTASGKTTLAQRLGERGLVRVAGSAALLPLLGDAGSSKTQRLLSWLAEPARDPAGRGGDADRLADLAVLRMMAQRAGGCVVESAGSVAVLLSPYNEALLIRLEATAAVRAQRVRRFLGGAVGQGEALRIVTRKDEATASACARSWGVDLGSPVHRRRFDLIVGCPDSEECTDPDCCMTAAGELAEAAVGVYGCYLDADSRTEVPAAADFAAVVDRWRPWVRRVADVLADLGGPVAPQRWRDRLAREMDSATAPGRGCTC